MELFWESMHRVRLELAARMFWMCIRFVLEAWVWVCIRFVSEAPVGCCKRTSCVAARQTCLAGKPCSASPWLHAKHVSCKSRSASTVAVRQACFACQPSCVVPKQLSESVSALPHFGGLLTVLRPPQPRWLKQLEKGVSAAPARSPGCWWPPSGEEPCG